MDFIIAFPFFAGLLISLVIAQGILVVIAVIKLVQIYKKNRRARKPPE